MTPVEQIQQITTNVHDLVDSGMLNQGQGDALVAKLDEAMQKLNEENNRAASNLLQAFINQVQAYINAGILSATEGQNLIDAANSVISQISG